MFDDLPIKLPIKNSPVKSSFPLGSLAVNSTIFPMSDELPLFFSMIYPQFSIVFKAL